jgi:hypothetical protein
MDKTELLQDRDSIIKTNLLNDFFVLEFQHDRTGERHLATPSRRGDCIIICCVRSEGFLKVILCLRIFTPIDLAWSRQSREVCSPPVQIPDGSTDPASVETECSF